jgi:hypothetical protein
LDSHPLVLPGHQYAKLWPPSARLLGYELDAMPRISAHADKRACDLGVHFESRPVPLERILVLHEGARVSVERLGADAALIELIRHTYRTRFLSRVNPRRHFHQSAVLCRAIPMYRLTRPKDFAVMSAVIEKIDEIDRARCPPCDR